jgi:hypothetical protein
MRLIPAIALLLTTSAFAQTDRVELFENNGRMHYGYTNLDQFDIRCDLVDDEGEDAALFIDRDFSGKPNHRLAKAWVSDLSGGLMGTLALDLPVTKVGLARCGVYCASIKFLVIEPETEKEIEATLQVTEDRANRGQYTAEARIGTEVATGTCKNTK